jgi:hypothetical protein
MIPDYSRQLERLIAVLSQKDSVPTWVISIVSAIAGALVTILLGLWKDRHDARHRRRRIERSICGEMLLNYSSLLGTLTIDFDFDRVAPHQKGFEGLFSLAEPDNARERGDILYDIPNFGAIQTVYKIYKMISEVSGGGADVRDLAVDGVRNFESLFVSNQLNRDLLIEMSTTCAPKLKPRLLALRENRINPGENLMG